MDENELRRLLNVAFKIHKEIGHLGPLNQFQAITAYGLTEEIV